MVDLRSDTVTRPTADMRAAMAAAPVGDDVFEEDPTVNRLEAMAADRVGQEAALFVPSGTMANLLAIKLHTRLGDEILMHEDAHPLNYEAGGAAAFAGVQIRALGGARGQMSPDAVTAAIRPDDVHNAPPALLSVEDTANRGGGAVHPLDVLDGLTAAAHARGLACHLDGARAFNAEIASGIPLARRTAGFDTVSFCFSKGLGAPVGSVLCGPRDQLRIARRYRKLLGGGMRQAGVLAAAAIHALEHHVDRLAEDHARARALAAGLTADGWSVAVPETNMVYVDAPGAPALVDALAGLGVRCFATGPARIRLVLHLDVDDAGVQEAVAGFRRLRG